MLGRPAGDPKNRHNAGYLTQSSSVHPDLSILDNMLYFAAVPGLQEVDPAADPTSALLESAALGER